jgi:hypothetical protein
MINNIQAMGQRNQLYRQNQDEYQRQKAFREQRDQVANAYLNPAQVPNKNAAGPDPRMPVPTQAHDPEKAIAAMGDVSPRAKVAGKTLAAQSKQADVSMMSSEDAKQFQQKENDIVSWISQNGIDSIDKIPPELTAGVPGQKALVSALEREAAKAENKQKLFKRRMDFLTPKYQIFSLQSDAVNKALLEGREDDVVMGLRQMVKDLPIPYQLGEFNPEDRSFDVKYFDRRTGKLQSVEKKPLTEVISEMNSTGKEEYFNQALLHMEAKRRENLEAEKNPLHGKTKGGTPVLITPQVPVQEPDGNLNIRVKDEKTGELLAEYKSWEALYDSGTSVENLEREYKKQQIATSKAAMGSHNRANQPGDGDKVDYNRLEKLITEGAKFFGQDGGDLFDAQGNLTVAGENVRVEALDFYNQHKGNPSALTGTDAQLFQISRAITDATSQYFGFGNEQAMGGGQPSPQGEGTPYTGSTPPPNAPGAKRDKKGHWFIQKNGRWEIVLGDGQQQVDPSQPAGSPDPKAGPEDPAATPGQTGATEQTQPQIRPELPQDMSQWNFQVIPQNGRQVPVVITDQGPIQLTPEEVEMYRQFSAQHKRSALGSAISTGTEWFKNNATGTQQITR